jgi:hypothetical protein
MGGKVGGFGLPDIELISLAKSHIKIILSDKIMDKLMMHKVRIDT